MNVCYCVVLTWDLHVSVDLIPVLLAGKEQNGEVRTGVFGAFGVAQTLHKHQAVGVQSEQKGERSCVAYSFVGARIYVQRRLSIKIWI